MLAYAVWFMSGPFLLYNYAAECAASAPSLFRGALENYAIFTMYAIFMMVLLTLAVSGLLLFSLNACIDSDLRVLGLQGHPQGSRRYQGPQGG